LIGENPGAYTCELLYNTQMDIVNPELNLDKTLLKTIDILGREVNHTPNQILFHIYDDGSVEKKFVVE